jgi:outer membrane protein assembly factor BamB
VDGDVEVIFGSNDHRVYVLNGEDGTLEWRYETQSDVRASPAIGDLNGDDTLEIVIGSRDGILYVLQNGDTLWTFTTGGLIYSSATLGDLNGDNSLDIVVGSQDAYVYALSGDGNLLWSYRTDGYIDHQSAALADIDGDDKLEVIIGSFGGECLYVIEGENGAEKWKLPMGWPVPGSPAIADIDGDDALEIVMSIHDGYCYAWEADGTELWRWGYIPVGDQDAPLALGDVDGDTLIEIVGSDLVYSTIFVLDFPVPDTVPHGVKEQSLINEIEIECSPNPFTNRVTIKCWSKDFAQLKIFDLTGKIIESFPVSDKGSFTIVWDAKKATPGIYFCKLFNTGGHYILRKIILLR